MVTVFCAKLGWYNLELLIEQFQVSSGTRELKINYNFKAENSSSNGTFFF